MRRFRVIIETGVVDGIFEEEFEVEDDATDAEIAAEAKEIFMDRCSYGFSEITGED